MSVYKKLMSARLELQSRKLNKSGLNKFAGYSYFELSDFLPTVQEIFAKHELCGVISYGKEEARLTIVDMGENGGSIEVTSPMSEAALKGCHPVQNLGAVQTYIRRYLWVTAMEIVEHDALDSSNGPVEKNVVHAPTGNPEIEPSRIAVVDAAAEAIGFLFAKQDIIGAYEEYLGITDGDEKIALWKLLPSHVRSAIKKHGDSLKGQK
ncbi:MAG: ERF family protein [Pseudomonadota bacterium]|nr:ERF family protein [Pseudomonadota bacterium]